MTVTGYALTNPDPTDPLSTPSHASLHTETNAAVASLGTRMNTVESVTSAAEIDIKQARRVADTWVIPGTLDGSIVGVPLLPVLWNLSPRAVEYEALKVSVLDAPTGSNIEVDVLVHFDNYPHDTDPNNTSSGTVLKSTLKVLVGSYFSETFDANDFITPVQNPDTYLQIVIKAIGSGEPGGNMTIQLNRLL